MFQLWDASGLPILTVTDRMGKFTGSVAVAANGSGSVNIPDPGTLFGFAIPDQSDTSAAEITISGSTLSWGYYGGGSYRQPAGACTIYYGVY